MRAVIVHDGAPARLKIGEVEEPEPTPLEALVRVSAISLNRGEVRRSQVAEPGFRPGWDLAGTVERDGGGFTAGQRVAGMVPWFTVGRGSYAEVVLAEPGWLAPVPDGVDDVTAGALPLGALTARQALDLTAVPAGATLLVTGASGAVGGYAVQLAAAMRKQGVGVVYALEDRLHTQPGWVAYLEAQSLPHRVVERQRSDAIIARTLMLDVNAALSPASWDALRRSIDSEE